MRIQLRNIFYILFALSGFTGLIYESIWTQYLRLFLGHAAYAQALVLAIFMGGIAAGSWICSRYSLRWTNLLLGYAVAEGTIGIFALIFHPAFEQATQWSYASVMPHIGSPVALALYKWALSACLILPQTLLLGMTFPLMAAGIIRQWPEEPGRSLSSLYFMNSLGAAIGVLVCGFALIRYFGLPGSMRCAGITNMGIACGVWLYARRLQFVSAAVQDRAVPAHDRKYVLLLTVSLFTGAASFMYEIGWIRMLSLVLGSSTHSFELMLCAFLLGLAFGGYWIRKRSDRADVIRMLARVQICMGLCALLSLLVYNHTFGVMQWLVQVLPKTDTGYALYTLSSGSLAVGIMFPATLFAGMTLPLITAALMRTGHGERSIGAVYAANTIGAIFGVFFAVHVGLPVLGLKGLMMAGAGVDITLGLVLVWSISAPSETFSRRAMITASSMCIMAMSAHFITLDPYKMGSGVYRYGTLQSEKDSSLIYYRDGKTATVSLFRSGDGSISLRTNGKVDASIQVDLSQPPTSDEFTMILSAALPLLAASRVDAIANIGFGSGLTTATLLLDDRVKEVHTIEIEPAMVEASKNIGPMVARAYTDPRSKLYIDDAKTFFAARSKKYDVIISEPSNVWVSGVADLFSDEFYRLVAGRLTNDGVFCQWLHLYELDNELAISVLKALSLNFTHVALYMANDYDLIILAKNNGGIIEPDFTLFQDAEIGSSLQRVYNNDIQNVSFRRIGDERLFGKYIAASSVLPNSYYYPILDQRATRSRFLNDSALPLVQMAYQPLPLQQLLAPVKHAWKSSEVHPTDSYAPTDAASRAMFLYDHIAEKKYKNGNGAVPESVQRQAMSLRQLFYEDCNAETQERIAALYQSVAIDVIPFLQPVESASLWNKLESGKCAASFTQQDRQWIALFKAVGQRDAIAMTNTAAAILSEGTDLPNGPLSYIVSVGMVGYIMQGEQGKSLQLWKEYQTRIYGTRTPSIYYQVLVALSMKG